MHPECVVLAELKREGNSFPSTDKISSFPNSNTWAFQGDFIPNTFCILYYDQLHFLLQRDLTYITVRPRMQQKEQYKLPEAFGYLSCTACFYQIR